MNHIWKYLRWWLQLSLSGVYLIGLWRHVMTLDYLLQVCFCLEKQVDINSVSSLISSPVQNVKAFGALLTQGSFSQWGPVLDELEWQCRVPYGLSFFNTVLDFSLFFSKYFCHVHEIDRGAYQTYRPAPTISSCPFSILPSLMNIWREREFFACIMVFLLYTKPGQPPYLSVEGMEMSQCNGDRRYFRKSRCVTCLVLDLHAQCYVK